MHLALGFDYADKPIDLYAYFPNFWYLQKLKFGLL